MQVSHRHKTKELMMSTEQALQLLAAAAALAPLPKQQHIQVEEALKIISEAIKK